MVHPEAMTCFWNALQPVTAQLQPSELEVMRAAGEKLKLGGGMAVAPGQAYPQPAGGSELMQPGIPAPNPPTGMPGLGAPGQQAVEQIPRSAVRAAPPYLSSSDLILPAITSRCPNLTTAQLV